MGVQQSAMSARSPALCAVLGPECGILAEAHLECSWPHDITAEHPVQGHVWIAALLRGTPHKERHAVQPVAALKFSGSAEHESGFPV